MNVASRDLHAFVDGELSEERRREVAQWLADQPEAAARVAAWRSQNEAIRRLFPAASAFRPQTTIRPPEPADEAIRDTDFRVEARRRRARGASVTFAMLAAVPLIAGAGVMLMRETVTGRGPDAIPFVSAPQEAGAAIGPRAVAAFRAYADDSLHAVEVAAADPALAGWLKARTGLAKAPDLAGARLVGARVLPGAVQPAAFLLYETGDRARLALVAERAQAAAPGAHAADGFAVRTWRADGFDFALAGRVPQTRLDALAAPRVQ